MKFLIKSIFFISLFIIVSLGCSLIMMVDDSPKVAGSRALSAVDLASARVFIDNSDPRKLAAGEMAALTVGEQDLVLLLNYGLDKLNGGGAVVELTNGGASVEISGRLPDNPLGSYLNVHLVLAQWAEQLEIENLQIGSLTLPGWIADPILQKIHAELVLRVPEYSAAFEAINGFSITDEQVNLVYQWQPDLIEKLANRGRDLLISPEEKARLMAHARNLSEITSDPSLRRSVSLHEIIRPMFQFAQARLGDPIEENRAAMIAMSLYMMGVNIPRVLGESPESIPPMGKHRISLSGRHDFAQHFLTSVGLTLSAGTGLTDSIGLLKEMEDSQGGSGFSFTDIGADRNGVRFAELAVSNTANAKKVQELLAGDSLETDYMAEFKDLPEAMPHETFKAIYGGVGEPAYNKVIEEIERRISATKLFRGINL